MVVFETTKVSPIVTYAHYHEMNFKFNFLISPSATYIHSIVKIGCMINYSNCCYRTKWVKANGIEYKCGIGVILNVEDDLPQVGYVQDIYIVNENFV